MGPMDLNIKQDGVRWEVIGIYELFSGPPDRHNAARAFRGASFRLKFLPSVQGGEARRKVKKSAGSIWHAPRGPRNGPRADQARANRFRRFDPPRFTITMVQPPTARARQKAAASDSPRRLGRARAWSSSAGSMSQSGKPRHPRRSNCNHVTFLWATLVDMPG